MCGKMRTFVVSNEILSSRHQNQHRMEIHPIAYFHSPFTSKFGIPKQAGLVASLEGHIVFTPSYRDKDALRGIEEFDYLWLIWEFSANPHAPKSLVVRPPRLGGNERVGVFASRSPFRPNRLGLSSVRLRRVEWEGEQGPVVYVEGADLMDGTPIYDIKPYVVYADSHPEARSGFVDQREWCKLRVVLPEEVRLRLGVLGWDQQRIDTLVSVLAQDPRPQYQQDPARIYGMPYAGLDIHFRVEGDEIIVVDFESR